MERIKNLKAEYETAKRRQNAYAHSLAYRTATFNNLNALGNLATRTRAAQTKLKNTAARKIQTAFKKPTRPYILVFNKSTMNRYPKRVKNAFKNVSFFSYPNTSVNKKFLSVGSFTFSNVTNKSGAKQLSDVYTFLKQRLPENMLPKFIRVNNLKKFSDKIQTIQKKANIIKRAFLPVRKIIYILRKHRNLRFAADIMERLTNLAKIYSEEIRRQNPPINVTKNTISRNIGLCHINTTLRNNPTINQVSYLIYYNNQMKFACAEIIRKKIPEKEFVTRFSNALGSRPCIENLIDALTQIAFGEIQWKGSNKAVNITRNNNKIYVRNRVIANYMKTHHKSIRSSGNKSNYTKNRLWNSIKNRPLYVLTQEHGPVFISVKNIRNLRGLSNNAFNMYSEFLE
jgi:hypothetical protein